MLIGEYRPSIDPKGRISFPSKLREALGESFVITKGLDGCLSVYRMEAWDRLVEKVSALPAAKARYIQRFIFASAADVEPDKQGRVLIPQTLREYAELGGGEIVVVGLYDHAEIWNAQKWDKSNAEITGEAVAAIMDELGF